MMCRDADTDSLTVSQNLCTEGLDNIIFVDRSQNVNLVVGAREL